MDKYVDKEYEDEEYEGKNIIPTFSVTSHRVPRFELGDTSNVDEYDSTTDINAQTISRYMANTRKEFEREIRMIRFSTMEANMIYDSREHKLNLLTNEMNQMKQTIDDHEQTINYLRNEVDELKRSTVNTNQMEKMSETIRWITNGY